MFDDEIYFSGASSLANTAQSALSGAAKAQKLANLGAKADLIGQGIGISSGIVSTIASVSDAKKRAEFQENLEKLSLQQQGELEKDIQRAKTVTERIGILTNAVAMIRVAEVNKKLEKKPQNDTKQLLFIIGGGFAVLLGVVIIKLMIRK
jgi:hypothetical protein